jgi:exodeoxyribonuclease V alpha subunit
MYFSGKVSRVIFSKREQGFYILKMLLDGEDSAPGDIGDSLVVVKGYVPGLSIRGSSWFGFEGKWVQDEKYGRQIEITKAPVFRGKIDPETVSSLLLENGIADMVTYELRRKFGIEMSEALKDPKRVQDALGISSFEAEFITRRWTSVCNRLRALEAVNSLGLPKAKTGEIWSLFGDDTEEILATNPWALVDIRGIPFAKMDELARNAGLPMDGDNRRKAAVIFSCRGNRGNGDLFMTSRALLAAVQRLAPELAPRQIAEALVKAHKEGLVVLDQTTRPGVKAVYDPWFYEMETETATGLWSRAHNAAQDRDDFLRMGEVGERTQELVDADAPSRDIVDMAIQECSEQVGFDLSPEQREGVRNGLLHSVSILTGLPGTGKSTSMQVLVKVLQYSRTPFLLVAPTGIAAKRLGSVCRSPAYTIHRALGAKGRKDEKSKRESTYAGIVGDSKGIDGASGKGGVWSHNPSNPHPAQVVIVDEFSMVDQHLLYRILQGTMANTRLVFVGDAAQLPSVGPGNVLRDMISADVFPVISLTQIFRQEDTSDIVTAAHAIYRGDIPSTDRNSDFVLLPVRDEEKIVQVIIRLAQKCAQRAEGWDEDEQGEPAPTYQVLSPRHMGTVGVTNLNSKLRLVLNPASPSLATIKIGKEDVRERDRVMVVQNNYDLGVFNGDIGTVFRIDRRRKVVQVQIHGSPPMLVSFPIRDVYSHLRLAYACTVHKYQGLEVDTVIAPIIPGFGRQLQRNLFYTAITRARKKVILVGSHSSLVKAIGNDKEDHRNTLFLDRLRTHFSDERTDLSEIA